MEIKLIDHVVKLGPKVSMTVAFLSLVVKDEFHETEGPLVLVRPQLPCETIKNWPCARPKKRSYMEHVQELLDAKRHGAISADAKGFTPGGNEAKKARTIADEKRLGQIACVMIGSIDKTTGAICLGYGTKSVNKSSEVRGAKSSGKSMKPAGA